MIVPILLGGDAYSLRHAAAWMMTAAAIRDLWHLIRFVYCIVAFDNVLL